MKPYKVGKYAICHPEPFAAFEDRLRERSNFTGDSLSLVLPGMTKPSTCFTRVKWIIFLIQKGETKP